MTPFTVSPHTFLVVFALGAAALAMWLHLRFPSWGPTSVAGVTLHLVVAGVGAHLAVAAAYGMAATDTGVLLATIGVALPAVVYIFTAAIWLIRLGQGVLSRYSR